MGGATPPPDVGGSFGGSRWKAAVPLRRGEGRWRRSPRSLFRALLAAAAAAMSGFFRRLGAIPWRSIAGDAFSRAFLVTQAFCAVHAVDHHLCSLAFPRGPSMMPAMNLAGDVVAVDRVSVRLGRVASGDVVLILSPEDPRKVVAKRVVGMEGDSVTYLIDPGNSDAAKTVVVPQGHVWVQGDNLYDSRDSRQFGAVPYGLIKGKIFCRPNATLLPNHHVGHQH